jgi:hypothetical protein
LGCSSTTPVDGPGARLPGWAVPAPRLSTGQGPDYRVGLLQHHACRQPRCQITGLGCSSTTPVDGPGARLPGWAAPAPRLSTGQGPDYRVGLLQHHACRRAKGQITGLGCSSTTPVDGPGARLPAEWLLKKTIPLKKTKWLLKKTQDGF